MMKRLLSAVLAATMLAAACGSTESDTTASDAASAETAAPDATDAGGDAEPTVAPDLTEEATAEPESAAEPTAASAPELPELIAAEIDDFMLEAGVPGLAMAVVFPEGEIIEVARGVADLSTDEPLNVDDYFRIGSITKTVTATVVLQLADEGLLDLDASVTSILGSWAPGYEYEDQITVRQLLNHTSGFIEFPFDPGFYIFAASRLDENLAPEELLAFASDRGPLFEVGTERSYTTTGFVAAGLVIEAVTGNTAAEEFASRIYDPLGLTEMYLPPEQNPPESVVHGYSIGVLAAASEALGIAPDDSIVDVDGAPYIDTLSGAQPLLRSVGFTGGSIEAQVGDTARMFRGLFAEGLVPDSLLADMLAPTLEDSYGLGVNVETVAGETVYSHGGGVPGFRSQAAYLPDHDIGIAFSATAIPIDPDVGQLAERIIKLVTG